LEYKGFALDSLEAEIDVGAAGTQTFGDGLALTAPLRIL
jgi:hypothetical protein